MLVSKKYMAEWTHIILDEVHDREEDIDLVMLICKELLKTNSPATKLVLMSATMNEEKFKTYFSIQRASLPGIEVPPLVQVKGREGGRVEERYWHHMAPFFMQDSPSYKTAKSCLQGGHWGSDDYRLPVFFTILSTNYRLFNTLSTNFIDVSFRIFCPEIDLEPDSQPN